MTLPASVCTWHPVAIMRALGLVRLMRLIACLDW